ncbi:hypothetical protein NFI96_020631 [Prochilodus magdalenae]|nr:hypothetical protein NFI96_020631 [Prochilodus magdalenae]
MTPDMKRKTTKVNRLRLSPNEEAQYIREELDRRRKLRVQQVREQERHIALQVRREVRERKERELQNITAALRDEWQEQRSEKIQTLEKLHKDSLWAVGQGYRNARQNEPDWDALARKTEENRERATERHQQALRDLASQRQGEEKRRNRHIEARKKALAVEKKRAMNVARLPQPVLNPIETIGILSPPPPSMANVECFSVTYCHVPETTVDRETETEQSDAHQSAKLEAQRLTELENEKGHVFQEQLEKAQLRGGHALLKEKAIQVSNCDNTIEDNARLLCELERLQQADLQQRRQIVNKIPAQIFQPLYRHDELRAEQQRELEVAFQDLYNAEREVRGDLILQPVPEPLPAPSAGTNDEDLDVTLDPSCEEDVTSKATPCEDAEAEAEEDCAVSHSHPVVYSRRPALRRLLERVRRQREQWSCREFSAEQKSAVLEDASIETGLLSNRESESTPTLEEDKSDLSHKSGLGGSDESIGHLPATIYEQEEQFTKTSRGSQKVMLAPVSDNLQSQRLQNYQQRLLEQNRVEKRGEDACLQLQEYQKKLQLRYSAGPMMTPQSQQPPLTETTCLLPIVSDGEHSPAITPLLVTEADCLVPSDTQPGDGTLNHVFTPTNPALVSQPCLNTTSSALITLSGIPNHSITTYTSMPSEVLETPSLIPKHCSSLNFPQPPSVSVPALLTCPTLGDSSMEVVLPPGPSLLSERSSRHGHSDMGDTALHHPLVLQHFLTCTSHISPAPTTHLVPAPPQYSEVPLVGRTPAVVPSHGQTCTRSGLEDNLHSYPCRIPEIERSQCAREEMRRQRNTLKALLRAEDTEYFVFFVGLKSFSLSDLRSSHLTLMETLLSTEESNSLGPHCTSPSHLFKSSELCNYVSGNSARMKPPTSRPPRMVQSLLQDLKPHELSTIQEVDTPANATQNTGDSVSAVTEGDSTVLHFSPESGTDNGSCDVPMQRWMSTQCPVVCRDFHSASMQADTFHHLSPEVTFNSMAECSMREHLPVEVRLCCPSVGDSTTDADPAASQWLDKTELSLESGYLNPLEHLRSDVRSEYTLEMSMEQLLILEDSCHGTQKESLVSADSTVAPQPPASNTCRQDELPIEPELTSNKVGLGVTSAILGNPQLGFNTDDHSGLVPAAYHQWERVLKLDCEKGILEESMISLVSLSTTTLEDDYPTFNEEDGKKEAKETLEEDCILNMANKRHKVQESHRSAKKKKTTETEFNGTVFKSMLQDPSTAFKGLEIFIRTAKNLPCANLYDVVEGYIKISAECAEILSLMEGDTHSETELKLIFQSLEMIFLRTASDLSHFSMVGSTIVKKIVSMHMKLLQSSLCSNNHQFVRQCLCLLAAMVSQGPESAREIFSSLVFNKILSRLVRLRDKTGRPDVRMAYIQLALSFMMCGDSSLVGHILDTKDFLSEILNNGLKEDRISIVSLILSTLQTKVVHNTAISKSQKVRFFSAATLAQIASLYRWNGIVDTTFDSQAMNKQEEGRHLVRDLAHNFLLDLCCSHKHGISFHDSTLGTASRPGNIVLLQFVVGLKQATEDNLVSELLVSILKCSPDILPRYFKETQFSFTPRMKGAWLDSIALLKKIYQAQPEVSRALQSQETVPVSRLLSMVLVTSLPPVCNKSFFTQGLKLPSVVGQHATLSLLAFILRRAQKNIEYSLKKPVWDSTDTSSPTAMEEFVQLYRGALSKILPDVMSIVSMWQSLSTKEKEGGDEDTGEIAKAREEVKPEEYGEHDPKLILFKALLLQVLCLYQKVVPHLISQSRFDFSKLLKGIMSEKDMKHEVPPVLQYQILQLALELPANKFSWFRLQDVGSPGLPRGEGSVFYLLLKMFIRSSSSSHLRTSTRMLILKVLRNSGVFEHTWRELELWVDHLLAVEPSQQEEAVQFLDQVLLRVVCNPYEYMDKVAAMMQEAVCLQAEISVQDRGAGNVPTSHISDELGALASMEDRGNVDEESGLSLSDDVLHTFPFSVIVPAVLETRNKLLMNSRDEKGVVCEYTCAVLCDVLHSQRDPLSLCLTLQHYDKELLSAENSRLNHSCLTSFYLYYSKWLSQKSKETWFSLEQIPAAPPAVDFCAFLKACYSEGPDAFLQDSFRPAMERSLSKLELSQFTGAVNQVLLYLRSFVDASNLFYNGDCFFCLPVWLSKWQATEVVACVLQVLSALLLKLHNTEETPPCQPELQEANELFIEMDSIAVQEVSKEQVLLFVFKTVFEHPVLLQWFLAVELDVVPHHSLKMDRVRKLCAQLTQGVLNLLQPFSETFRDLNALELVSPYLSATKEALLKELQRGGRCLKEESQSVKAFLALYEYMEPSNMMEILSALLLLPQSNLLTEVDELSVYGHVVLKVLKKSSAPPEKNLTSCLSSAHLCTLAALHTSCHSAQIDDVLLQVLQREPGSAKLVPTDVLLHCLQHRSNLDLAALLVQNCSTHCLSFELWCLEHSNLADITTLNSGFVCLLTSYIQQAATLDPCRPKDIQNKVLQKLTKTLLTELLSSAVQVETCISLDHCMEILSSLIQLVDMAPELFQLIANLPACLQKPDNYERWQLADSILEKLADTPEEVHWRKSLLTAAFHWLSTTYKVQKKPQFEKEEAMLKRLTTLLISPEDVSALDWNIFVKSGLKYRYQNQGFLVTLNSLLKLMYKNVNASEELLSIKTLHMMVTSHSLFLSTILASQNEADSSSECKEALVSLLLTLVKISPEVCTSSHFPVLLGAYGATLSPTDQKLLLLLQEYEKKNFSLVEFQCVLWGPAAVDYQKTQKCLGPSLWQQPSSEQLLAQFAADRMLNTIALFPLDHCLVPQVDKEFIWTEKRKGTPDKLCLYDPCFLLPLFSFILRPESVVDCRAFVSCHALGVTVMALSSYDHKMRSAAYHILSSFYEHLEGAHFREKKQLTYLLDTVKNGIQKQNLRVPFVHTTYIAKLAQQILRPEEHMYLVIHRFLLGTQYVDLNRVPDFFKLFYSFDLEHKLEREWMLNVLEEGIMDRLSFDLCEQQSIFHTLLGFSSSPLCDQSCQIQILNILGKSAHVTRAAYDLIKAHGILSWIIQLIEKRCLDGRLLSAVIGLLHSLWFTNLDEKKMGDQQVGSAKCFSLPVINDFMSALLSVIRHMRSGLEVKEVQAFLQTLASVMRHQKMALGAHRASGWLTMHPHNLSCSAALSLLHCWGTLAQDKALLLSVQDLANKHCIRSLMAYTDNITATFTVWCRHRGKTVTITSPLWVETQRRNKRQKCLNRLPSTGGDMEMNETETGKGKAQGKVQGKVSSKLQSCQEPPCEVADGYLDNCRSLLMNILTHWDLHGDVISDSSSLVYATARIALKWTLKSLSEMPYDESKTCATLKWFQSVILPSKTITKTLLSDETLGLDLLRLYHQTCSCRVQEYSISNMETLKLFTSVMVHLLEAKRTPDVLHDSVIKACLHTTADEGAREEAGLKLLSLYIHEVWSGATVPQLLLTHARLVTRDRKKSRKRSRSPIELICEHILSASHMV